jgi:hypothetical protein
MLAQPIVDQSVYARSSSSFSLPAGTFIDVDAGDSLTFSATLVSGAALPSWLKFDAATQTFTGTPTNADVGTINLRMTATDGSSASTFDDFVLNVAGVNSAPVLANPIADQASVGGSAFTFVIPGATFSDADPGDTLHYRLALDNGAPTPSWLKFDGQTRTLTGTPSSADVGQIVLRVTATDDAGAGAQALFTINVAAPLLPPAVPAPSPSPPAADPVLEPQPVQAPIHVIASAPDAPPVAELSTASPTPSTTRDVIATRANVPPPLQPEPTPTVPGRVATWLDAPSNDMNTATVADSTRRESIDQRATTTRLSNRAEALLGNAILPQFNELSAAPMTQLLHDDGLMHKLEQMRGQLLEQVADRRTVIASSIAISGGLSIGYVVWLVRGGVLVSSMLSALPAWQMIDPMPVLAAARSDAEKKDKRAKPGDKGSDPSAESEV